MKIALDAFGGDFAPEQQVLGALEAARMYGIETILVGSASRLEKLTAGKEGSDKLEIVDAPDVISMNDSPVEAVRSKTESSLVKAASLVKQGRAQALVSAGNTGAAMAASLLIIGRIKGVERPAIATPMPTTKGVCLIADAGANVDCRPSQLLQFGQMASVYAAKVFQLERPKIGLLNVGEEATKGNETVQKAYQLLSQADLNFVGNIEGRDIAQGAADVVVCDGFVGNVVLKFAEGLGTALFGMMKEEFVKTPLTKLGAVLLKPGLKNVKNRVDYTEYGGAPLLGVKGISIIAHGSSNAKAIRNALRVAAAGIEHQVVQIITETMAGE